MTAPESLAELIEKVVDAKFPRRFRYFKLVENEVPPATSDGLDVCAVAGALVWRDGASVERGDGPIGGGAKHAGGETEEEWERKYPQEGRREERREMGRRMKSKGVSTGLTEDEIMKRIGEDMYDNA